MKLIMGVLTGIWAAIALHNFAWGGEPTPNARARAAMALAYAGSMNKATCDCGEGCTCADGECGSPNCPSLSRNHTTAYASSRLTLSDAIDKSLDSDKPLCIWVGETAPSIESGLKDCIHVHVDSFQRATGETVDEPTLVLGRPSNGKVVCLKSFAGVPARDSIRSALDGQTTAVQSSVPVLQPMPVMLPMASPCMGGGCSMGGCGMPMMGGFGGCAGGCCGR